MKFTLTTNVYRPDGIFGAFLDEDGNRLFYTLEHAFEVPGDPVTYVPKVAAGVYACERHAPNRLKYETFMLQNVPAFQGNSVSGILIHVLNYNEESDGCIGLGDKILLPPGSRAMITDSKYSLDRFMKLVKDVNTFQLEIKR